MKSENTLEPIEMASVQQNAEMREERYRYSRKMLETYPEHFLYGSSRPDALKALEKLKETMDKEGHMDHWIYHDKYVCRIQRNTFGDWCGYVGVPAGHPCHGMNYNEVDNDVEVHGGLTFSELVHNWAKDRMWFFGFDCGHAFDINFISIRTGMNFPEMTYKDKEYVTAETNKLAKQLEEMEKKNKK